MGKQTYEFDYEVRYRGQIKIDADSPADARQQWQVLTVDNLISNSRLRTVNLLNVSSGSPPQKY